MRHLFPPVQRHGPGPHRRAGLAAALLLVLAVPAARAQDPPRDPVDALRLRVANPDRPEDDVAQKKYADDLSKLAANLTTLTELFRGLTIDDWKNLRPTRPPRPPEVVKRIEAAHGKVYLEIGGRFKKGVTAAVERGSPATQTAVINLLLELAQRPPPGAASDARDLVGELVPGVVQLARSPDPGVAQAMARAVGAVDTAWVGERRKEALGAMEELLLKTKDARTRLVMARTVGETLDRLSPLRQGARLRPGELQFDRTQVAERFLAAATPVVPLLGQALADGDTAVRLQAVQDLQLISDVLAREGAGLNVKRIRDVFDAFTGQAGSLEKVILDGDASVRSLARQLIESLALARASLPPEDRGTDPFGQAMDRFVKPLEQGLTDRNIRARLNALDALEAMGAKAAPAARSIAARLGDADKFVRWAAARTLGRIGGKPPEGALDGLTRLLSDEDPALQLAAAVTLGIYGDAAVSSAPALARAALRGDVESRVAMMQTLAKLGKEGLQKVKGAEGVIADLAANLDLVDRSGPDRKGAPPAFVIVDPPPGNPRIRVEAAVTLSKFRTLARSAEPALVKALDDPDPGVRRAASEALLNIKDN